jgi:hypothetical protein
MHPQWASRVAEEKVNLNRKARQLFLANVIVTDVEAQKQITGLIRNLSLSGCYVETATPLSPGINVRLIIAHNGEKLRAFGNVARVA